MSDKIEETKRYLTMTKTELLIKSAYLTTKNKSEGLDLVSGKISTPDSSGSFLFYLIELSKALPNSKTVKKIVQVLENNMKVAEAVDDAYFEKVVNNVNKSLKRLAENEDNSWLGHLNAVIGIISNENLSLTQTGNITGYIFRKNKISEIAGKAEAVNAAVTFGEITAGKLLAEDQILFGNFRLLNRISLDRIRGILKNEIPETQIQELGCYLQKNKVKDVNAVILQTFSTPPTETDTPDIFYLDEDNSPFREILNKKIKPAANQALVVAIEYLKKFFTFSKKNYRIFRKNWNEKYGPETKKIFNSSKDSLGDFIVKSEKKIGPKLSKFKEDYQSKIKIKAKSYSKHTDSPFGKSLLLIVDKISLSFKRENRKYLYVALIVIALIIGYNKIRENNQKRSEIAKQIENINSYDKAAEAFNKVKEDILLGKTDDLSQAYTALELAQNARLVEANKNKADKLIKEIKNLLDEKTKTARIIDAPSFDFYNGVSNILIAGSEIYSIDSTGKLILADVREKKASVVATLPEDAGKFANFSYSDSQKKIYVSTQNNRLFVYSLADRNFSEISVADSGKWEDAFSIANYSTNLYLLDSENGQVWKHILGGNSYSKGTTYADTSKISLRGAVDLVVDGNLWVLQNNGTVNKFVKGALEPDFALKAIPKPDDQILVPSKIYTEEGSNSLFILDKKKNRILKFDKSGDFVNQYVFDNISLDSFAVNTKLQKIWGLSGGKIYEGNL